MMTKSRALARARLMFGPKAHVSSSWWITDSGERRPRCCVGVLERVGGLAAFHMVRGTGATWEQALDEADRYLRGVSVTFVSEELALLLEQLNAASTPCDDATLAAREKLVRAFARAQKRDASSPAG